MIRRFGFLNGPAPGACHFRKRGMMHIPRLLTLAVAVASLSAVSPVVAQQQRNQQQQNQNNQQQQQRSQAEQRDIQALVQLVDAVSAGQQPAPTDISVTWDSSHFVKSGDGSTYIPYTVSIGQLAMPGTALYVRVVDKKAPPPAPAPAANQNNQNRNQAQPPPRVVYPWDNIYFLNLPTDGKVSRALALRPGEYEVFIAVKERTVGEPPRNAPPPAAGKAGLLRRDLTVPDFGLPELNTSTVIIANSIEPLTQPLSREQQQENPYVFGTMKVVPSPDLKLKKSGELQVLFWVYGTQVTNGKPDVVIDYNFHQKTAEGEKYFNKTAPQPLNAETLPPQFDVAMGHQLPGSLVVPLASFPEGEYRLEIKVTDKLANNKVFTQNATFTVVP